MEWFVPAAQADREAEPATVDDPQHFIDLDTRRRTDSERAGSWNRALVKASVPLNVYSEDADGFAGRLRADLIGDLRILTIQADAQTVVRTPSLTKVGDEPAFYKFILHLSGHCRVTQDDRTLELVERTLVVYDTTRAYTLEFYGPYTHQVLMIPRDAFSVPAGSMATITATPIPIERGAARVLSRMLRDLRNDIGDLSLRNRLTIAETLIELSEAVVRERLGSALSAAESGVFAEILAFIEHHLGDPSLTPQVIASAHFMSLRSLQLLFQSREQSPSGWIRRRRLENGRRDLLRFPAEEQPVAAIAARWGFPDAGTFARAFKKAFGVPPQEYRRRAVPSATDPAVPLSDDSHPG